MDTVIDEGQARELASGATEQNGDWAAALSGFSAQPDASGSGGGSAATAKTADPRDTKAASGGDPEPQAGTQPQASKVRGGDLPPDDDAAEATPEPAKVEPPKDAGQFKGAPKQLREQYELTKREKADLERKVRELSEARESGTKAEVEKATKALREEMDAIRKEHESAQAELRFARYTRSAEYKDRFQKPLEKAYTDVMTDLDGIVMTDEAGTERAVNFATDLQPIFEAPTAKALQMAKEMFGDAASVVMQHRAAIVRLQNEARSAIEDYRKNGAEHEKRMEEQARVRREEMVQKWGREVESVVSERPRLFAKPTDDDSLAKAWDDGDAIVNAALLGRMPDGVAEDAREEFAVQAQAQVAARARAFGVLAHRVHKLNAENRRLQDKIKALEGAEPKGASRRQADAAGAKPGGWEDALRSMA